MDNNISNVIKITDAHTEERSLDDMMLMLKGYQITQILETATKLGIFEKLLTPMSSNDLSKVLNTDPDCTERLLNACVGLKFLGKDIVSPDKAFYRINKCSRKWLLKSSPTYFTSVIELHGQELYGLWAGLTDIIKTGKSHVTDENKTLWDNENIGAYRSEGQILRFMSAMRGYSAMDGDVLGLVDFSLFKRICDIGAGPGTFSTKIAQNFPTTDVVLFDLPQVTRLIPTFLESKLPNLQIITGDYFKDVLPAADLYILGMIIHGWKDVTALTILKKVFHSLPKDGAVLLQEVCLNETKDGPLDVLLFDLNMAVHTGGKERSFPEYRELLSKAGFTNIELLFLSSGNNKNMIFGRKGI